MVDWANIYFLGKVILSVIGIVSQLFIIFLIWINGGFKK